MHPSLNPLGLCAGDVMTPHGATVVLERARALQHAANTGQTQAPLRGRNLGLLCEDSDGPDAVLFKSAAIQLGAHVAHIQPSRSAFGTPQELQQTARMLGRFYDAVECQGMAASLVNQVAADAGVMVFDGAATDAHPTAALAGLLDAATPLRDRRRFVLQALLLASLA